MKSIDLLEHGGATGTSPFALRHHGEYIALPDPRTRHYQWVLTALQLGHVPGTPGDLPEWKRALVFDRWCAAWDLPHRFEDARRLAYLVDHYRAAMSHDLHVHAHADLGDLWRARRWTLILDIVDRLPGHSQFGATIAMDEEHAQMMAEALAARNKDGGEDKDSGPPLTTWTPEVAVLTNVLDAVKGVQYAVVAVQAEKGKAPEPPKPSERPVTPLQRALKRAEFDRRKAAHDALVARVLPHKAKPKPPVH